MNPNKDGGPAFPLVYEISQPPADAVPGKLYVAQPATIIAHGISVRDYFAAKAMPMLISLCQDGDGGWSHDTVAQNAYFLADAMLAAREA